MGRCQPGQPSVFPPRGWLTKTIRYLPCLAMPLKKSFRRIAADIGRLATRGCEVACVVFGRVVVNCLADAAVVGLVVGLASRYSWSSRFQSFQSPRASSLVSIRRPLRK